MSAKDLIRRLRSNGVRVYLSPAGNVTFKGLDDAPNEWKIQVMAAGRELKRHLEGEARVKEMRRSLREEKHTVNNATDEEL